MPESIYGNLNTVGTFGMNQVHGTTDANAGESRRIRRYRSVSVCLVVLCVLLLTAVIVLCVQIYTNYYQFHINNKNITQERDQLLTNNIRLTQERDQLHFKNANLTIENDGLLSINNNLNEQKEEITRQINRLWEILNETDGWIYYQSSLYLISSEKKSWTESRRYCRERGADLIIINNKEEQDFAINISNEEYIWIGLSDSDVEGRWKWVDNSTLTSGFWGSGEPNGGTKENCVESHSSRWADYTCTYAFKWICEKCLSSLGDSSVENSDENFPPASPQRCNVQS